MISQVTKFQSTPPVRAATVAGRPFAASAAEVLPKRPDKRVGAPTSTKRPKGCFPCGSRVYAGMTSAQTGWTGRKGALRSREPRAEPPRGHAPALESPSSARADLRPAVAASPVTTRKVCRERRFSVLFSSRRYAGRFKKSATVKAEHLEALQATARSYWNDNAA